MNIVKHRTSPPGLFLVVFLICCILRFTHFHSWKNANAADAFVLFFEAGSANILLLYVQNMLSMFVLASSAPVVIQDFFFFEERRIQYKYFFSIEAITYLTFCSIDRLEILCEKL